MGNYISNYHKKEKEKLTKIAIICIIIMFILSVFLFNRILEDKKQSVRDITLTISNSIDTKKYHDIILKGERTEYFYYLQEYFLNIQKEVNYKYIYTERMLSKDSIEYVIDTDIDFTGDSFGYKDENKHFEYYTLSTYSEKSYVNIVEKDKWGYLFTVYVPLIHDNKIISLVGVDVDYKSLLNETFKTLIPLFIFNVICLFVGFSSFNRTLKKSKREEINTIKLYGKGISLLTRSLAKKSDYTWKHSERVGIISEIMCRNLGYSKDKTELVKWASYLHDIGKIGIPETLLNKSTNLTDSEYEIIKQHPLHGVEILAEFNEDELEVQYITNVYKIVSDIISCHHERYDGEGYPFGLKGDKIPELARLLAVADSFEAIVSERPYKKKKSYEEGIEMIEKDSGSHFDPKMVRVFIDSIAEITVALNFQEKKDKSL